MIDKKEKRDIRGAIFDVDGTLLDSMNIWDQAGARYLQGLGKEPEQGLNKILFSLSLADGAAYLKKAYDLVQTEEEIHQGVLDVVDAFYRDEAQAKAGVRELLAALSAKGVAMTVATSSDKRQIRTALERLDLAKYFQELFTCGEVGGSKNEPEIFHRAAALMGTTPEDTCVVEDGLYAVRTANNAGYYTIGVYDASSHDDWQDLQKEADLALESLEDVQGIIDELTE
ncbi:MAG: HAD family phosphatase [Firmicutes bacterium]|nr:HAD family phosphatase [Bacillota bacterium]